MKCIVYAMCIRQSPGPQGRDVNKAYISIGQLCLCFPYVRVHSVRFIFPSQWYNKKIYIDNLQECVSVGFALFIFIFIF